MQGCLHLAMIRGGPGHRKKGRWQSSHRLNLVHPIHSRRFNITSFVWPLRHGRVTTEYGAERPAGCFVPDMYMFLTDHPCKEMDRRERRLKCLDDPTQMPSARSASPATGVLVFKTSTCGSSTAAQFVKERHLHILYRIVWFLARNFLHATTAMPDDTTRSLSCDGELVSCDRS